MPTPTLDQALAQRDEARELLAVANALLDRARPFVGRTNGVRERWCEEAASHLAAQPATVECSYVGRCNSSRCPVHGQATAAPTTGRGVVTRYRDALQRALDVANADRDALRALLDVSAERIKKALFWLADGSVGDLHARTRAREAPARCAVTNCPCGRPRAGCEYHDPALQPPPLITPTWVDIKVRLSDIRHDRGGLGVGWRGSVRGGRSRTDCLPRRPTRGHGYRRPRRRVVRSTDRTAPVTFLFSDPRRARSLLLRANAARQPESAPRKDKHPAYQMGHAGRPLDEAPRDDAEQVDRHPGRFRASRVFCFGVACGRS